MKTFAYNGAGCMVVREPGHPDIKMVGITSDEQITRLILQECKLDAFFNGPPFLDEVLRCLGHAGVAFSLTDEAVFRWHADRVARIHFALPGAGAVIRAPFVWERHPTRRPCPGCGRPVHPGELVSVSPEDWRCLYCLEGR